MVETPARQFSHHATPVKVVRARRGSTFPSGGFPLVVTTPRRPRP